jgi:hypothetical protein
MCAVSMVGDHYRDWIPKRYPDVFPIWPQSSEQWPVALPPEISRKEFDDLKKTVEEMRDFLKRAKEYDERNNEPECEVEEKMELLRRVADLVGINLDDIIGKSTKST